jgi:hypothetical protein
VLPGVSLGVDEPGERVVEVVRDGDGDEAGRVAVRFPGGECFSEFSGAAAVHFSGADGAQPDVAAGLDPAVVRAAVLDQPASRPERPRNCAGARPLAKVVGVGSAAGWVAAALVFAWTLASGRALSAVTGEQPVVDMALGVIDVGTGLLVLSRRSPQSDRPRRATRRAMRRAQMDVGRRPGTRASLWRRLQFFLVPSAAASLPRPLRGLLAAGLWTSVLAAIWQFGAGDGRVQDQRLAASV